MEYINNKSIAILMATYNAERFLKEQIDSIISQSNDDWTLYIRDDESTDGTMGILHEYTDPQKKMYNPNIVLVIDEKGNLGCRDNFFQMLSVVDSEYYMFCDADDVWLKNKVQRSYDVIKETELQFTIGTPILVHTDLEVVDENLNTISKSMWESGGFDPDKIKNINYLGIHCFVGGATSIFNVALKNVSMPFSNRVYLHDLWMALNAMKYGKIISLHESLIRYRQHGINTAGAALHENLRISSKIHNIKKTLRINIETAKMLREIGWGGYLKYLYYKVKLIYLIRSGKAL